MENLITVIIVIAFCVLLFVVLRQVMLWYWKIDIIVKNQEMTNQLLANNNALLNEQLSFMKSSLKPEQEPAAEII